MNDKASDDTVSQPTHTMPPRPTYAPAAMALGVMLLFWGVVTMWIMSVVGASLVAWSLWTWIDDVRAG